MEKRAKSERNCARKLSKWVGEEERAIRREGLKGRKGKGGRKTEIEGSIYIVFCKKKKRLEKEKKQRGKEGLNKPTLPKLMKEKGEHKFGE